MKVKQTNRRESTKKTDMEYSRNIILVGCSDVDLITFLFTFPSNVLFEQSQLNIIKKG